MKQVFDALRFLVDYRIDFRTDGNKHCSPGWVNIHCPFCAGGKDYHLGIHLTGSGCCCWRCGKKKLWDVIKAITGPSQAVLTQIKERYYRSGNQGIRAKETSLLTASSVKLPKGIVEGIPNRAQLYLEGRNFDPEQLTKTWNLQYTGPIGSYKFRIVAPIYLPDGTLISYQGRDYTGRAGLRYKACRKEEEVIPHQDCLYGEGLVHSAHIIVVEGIADAWRLGPGAVACFGIAFTSAQVERLAQYQRVTIIFDGEERAMAQAHLLSQWLKGIDSKIDVQIIEIMEGDPAELDQWDADKLMYDLLGR